MEKQGLPREVAEREAEVARAGAARTWAALAVVALACSLPVVPVLVASGLMSGMHVPALGGAAAGLAAVFGGGKLAAMAWGLAGRWEGTNPEP